MTGQNTQHDLEQAHSSSQREEGLLEVLRVVDWWKVRNTSSVRYTKSYVCGCFMLSVPNVSLQHSVWHSRCAGCC